MWFLLFVPLVLAQEQVAVQLAPGTNAHTWGDRYGMHLARTLEFLPDFYVFEMPAGGSGESRARGLRDTGSVVWAELQEQRPKRFTRVDIPDLLWNMQWSLHAHPFAVDVDKMGNLSGRGVTIAIVDDGLQWQHPEIHGNYDASHSWDYNDNDADPTPLGPHAGHGTSAAGVAAALAGNAHCGRGVAPKARLVGLRTIAEGVSDATEAEALTHEGLGVVSIYSNSWGPADDSQTMEGPGYVVQSALAAYTAGLRGRLGKGSIYLWASGNGAAKGDSCAYDGYAASPFVFAIGALDHTGHAASYSEGCAALFAVAPSSGAGRGITTADLMGDDGYTDSECTIGFGGTSAATPLAAGLIALLLEVQPQLTWRDLQYVLARGALPIDAANPDWHTNAAGYHHSHRYGFGMLHGPSLLRALASHTLLANRTQAVWRSGFKSLDDLWIHNETLLNVTVTTASSSLSVIERVTLHLALSTVNRASLSIALQSPEGTISQLGVPRPLDATPFWPAGGWDFHSVRHLGERTVNGVWRIIARDTDASTQGQTHFIGYELVLRGAPQ